MAKHMLLKHLVKDIKKRAESYVKKKRKEKSNSNEKIGYSLNENNKNLTNKGKKIDYNLGNMEEVDVNLNEKKKIDYNDNDFDINLNNSNDIRDEKANRKKITVDDIHVTEPGKGDFIRIKKKLEL